MSLETIEKLTQPGYGVSREAPDDWEINGQAAHVVVKQPVRVHLGEVSLYI